MNVIKVNTNSYYPNVCMYVVDMKSSSLSSLSRSLVKSLEKYNKQADSH